MAMGLIKKLILEKIVKYKSGWHIYFDLPYNFADWDEFFEGHDDTSFVYLKKSNTTYGPNRNLVRIAIDDQKINSPVTQVEKLLSGFVYKFKNGEPIEGRTISKRDELSESEYFEMSFEEVIKEFKGRFKTEGGDEDIGHTGSNFGATTINSSTTHLIPFPTSTSSKLHFFDVGHGLSVFDEENNLIFDMGGTASKYDEYIKNLASMLIDEVDVVISHCHRDHYNYLNRLLKDKNKKPLSKNQYVAEQVYSKIRKIYIRNIGYGGKNVDDIVNDRKTVHISENAYKHLELNGYVFPILSEAEIAYTSDTDLNKASIFGHNNNVLLTGDIPYNFLLNQKSIIANTNRVFQIPHHGSFTSHSKGGATETEISIKFSGYAHKIQSGNDRDKEDYKKVISSVLGYVEYTPTKF